MQNIVPASEVWSDYDGDEIYGDFTVHQDGGGPAEAKQERSFVMGLATVGWTDNTQGERVPDDPSLRYYHADMIGTTRFMTDFIGDPGEEAVFTAFGERIDGSPRRFGYAGSWGYQSTLDDDTPPAEVFPFLHLGARYYDPATGRFLQRDPIGVDGGLNVYAYAYNNPALYIDPSGLGPWSWIKKKGKGTWNVLKRLPGYILPSSPVPADAAPGAASCLMYDAKRRHALRDHEDALPDPKCPACKRLTPKSAGPAG